MATPLTDSINALTQYANEVTGKQDTTLSDAVGSLVEGYGQGGSWKTLEVTASEEIYQRADLIKTWLESVVPESSMAIIWRNNFVYDRNATRGAGTLLIAVIINNTPSVYTRYFNSNVNSQNLPTSWGSNFYLSVDAGDKYTISYKD